MMSNKLNTADIDIEYLLLEVEKSVMEQIAKVEEEARAFYEVFLDAIPKQCALCKRKSKQFREREGMYLCLDCFDEEELFSLFL